MMLSTDAALISTLCISSLLLLLVPASQGTGALDPAAQNKAQLLENPYFRAMGPGAGAGPYQDFYEMPSQYEAGWKRAPNAGFYGMRGKKAPTNNNFYGMRGKKGPVGFLGMRGKKMEQGSVVGGPWGAKDTSMGALSEEDKSQAPSGDDLFLKAEQQSPATSATSWEKRVPAQGFMGLRGRRSLDEPIRRLTRLH